MFSSKYIGKRQNLFFCCLNRCFIAITKYLPQEVGGEEVDAERDADVPVAGGVAGVVAVACQGGEGELVADVEFAVERRVGEGFAVVRTALGVAENLLVGQEAVEAETGRDVVVVAVDGHDAGGYEAVGAEGGVKAVV